MVSSTRGPAPAAAVAPPLQPQELPLATAGAPSLVSPNVPPARRHARRASAPAPTIRAILDEVTPTGHAVVLGGEEGEHASSPGMRAVLKDWFRSKAEAKHAKRRSVE